MQRAVILNLLPLIFCGIQVEYEYASAGGRRNSSGRFPRGPFRMSVYSRFLPLPPKTRSPRIPALDETNRSHMSLAVCKLGNKEPIAGAKKKLD